MSGICGILQLDGAPASAYHVEKQLEVLAHRGPDRRIVKAVEGVIGAQLDRMKAGRGAPRNVDLNRIRTLLAARNIEDHNSGWEQETQVAVRALLLARFVEWFPPNN